jgi:hypothetical protein
MPLASRSRATTCGVVIHHAAWLLALALFFVAAPAHAHAMRSAFVEIDEMAPGHASVHVRVSVPDGGLAVDVSGCALELDESDGFDRAGSVTCGDTLAGHAVTVRGLGPVLTEAVVWIRYADGASFSHLLAQGDTAWTLPANGSAWTLARQYVRLGVAHIMTGYDHLLFLFLLVLTLRRPRAVLLAETAFTVSHSIAFTATALGWVRVPPALAEACIAWSLVLVALDVGKPAPKGRAGLAFLFGLVHGLGFAEGLREIGLPERDVATALVSFGAGVEIGQVAFLAVALVAMHLARRARAKIALVGAYGGGALAASWFIERALACVSG